MEGEGTGEPVLTKVRCQRRKCQIGSDLYQRGWRRSIAA